MHQCQFLSFDKFTIVLLLNRFLGLPQPVKFITSQTRNPGKILLGAPIAAEGSENKEQVPLFTHCLRKMGKPIPGMRVEVCPGVGPEERLRYFAHPLGGIVCRGACTAHCFYSRLFRRAVVVVVVLAGGGSLCIFCPELALTAHA